MMSPSWMNRCLLHVGFRNARLRTRGQHLGVSNDVIFLQIESVAVAIRTCGNAARNDRFASLTNFVILRRFYDLLRAGGALSKMTLRHSCLVRDCISWLNADSSAGNDGLFKPEGGAPVAAMPRLRLGMLPQIERKRKFLRL